MGSERGVWVLQVLDMLVYGVGLAVLLGGSAGLAVFVGTGSVTLATEAVFLVGLGLLFVGVVMSRPRREELLEGDDDEPDVGEPTAVQQRLARLVPDQSPLPPSRQPSLGPRLLVAGFLLQLVAFVRSTLV